MTATETLSPAAPTRNQTIAARAEAGEDLTAISLDYNMSRERVRQIVEATSTKTNGEIREARRVRRDQARLAAENTNADLVRRTAEENPDATLSDLVDLCGFPFALVRDALDWTERERRAVPQVYASVPDVDVFAEIRRVAGLPGGQPLTGSFYDANREGGLSHARLLQRYETWNGACKTAGVVPQEPNASRVYIRAWTPETMVRWVWGYLTSTDSPSYARFEQWLRAQDGAPSGQTVRNTLGSWVEMKRRAIEAHAPSRN